MPESCSFEVDAAEVLTRLRSALSEIVAAVPERISKGADLHRALKIDRQLSWKVFKVVSAADPVTAGPHVPSRGNMSTFLKAARKQGVPEPLIDSALGATADFESLVATHAGDRATFDSMVSALARDESAEQLDLVHRRLAFRAQRHLLGIQAKTQLKLIAMQPSTDPNLLDGIRVEGFFDLCRLRGDAPLVVAQAGAQNDDGSPVALNREPLEPGGALGGMSLLRGFCSRPLPEFRAAETGRGFMRGELIGGGVGNQGAITCVEGHITRTAVPRYSDEENKLAGTVVAVRTPCEVLILDLLQRKDTYGEISPTVVVHAEHLGETTWDSVVQNRFRLPWHPTVSYLGRGPSVLHTPDIPRYAELGRYVFERAGWEGSEFDVYRCRIEYPIMPSSVELRFDLPDPPSK